MKQDTALNILKTGRNVYLTGAAGSGKTHVLNQYIQYLRKNNASIGITASTGIAATHLSGMTIHAWSGIGINDYLSEWEIDSLTQRQPLAKRYERTSVLLIDEVSMLRPEILDVVDQVARAMKRNNEPFGGMQVVLSGDFFQLPPIVRDGSEEAFIDSSRAWHEGDFRVCYLTEQYRQEGGKLLDILNDIRDGEISTLSQESLESRMSNDVSPDENAVVLHTHNRNVDERNVQELSKLDGESSEYEMTSTGRANLIETLKKSVLAPELLELKIGARVMFVKNSPEQDYVNGTLGEITDLDGEYPIVQTNSGKEIVARPVSWETTDDAKVLASVTQVPLRLAW
ncbi:MAG: AAA family ATPase, partial [Candidatus Pacebacteria bacterium]|nr:AAA family ATPase [Candidatus Paceibacterota bacterium]